MSIQSITYRCDHIGCVESTTSPNMEEGWVFVAAPLTSRLDVTFHYCPDHAHLYMQPPEGFVAMEMS